MRPTLARAPRVALQVVPWALAFALAACGSKEEPAPAPGSASAAGPARPTEQAPPPRPAAEATPAPPMPGDGALPAACDEYRATILRLAQCGDAIPPSTRDNLRAHFEQQWAGWAKLPEAEQRALAAICKSSADSVKEAASAACGW